MRWTSTTRSYLATSTAMAMLVALAGSAATP